MKKKNFDRYFVILFVIAAFTVAAYYGIERIFNVDFVCTNGDYQNYNVLRRFLDGQVPYKDFANYLGMGLLIMCGPLLSVHNTFAGNLFVTNMVASFAFIIFVTLIFYFVTGNKKISCLAGLLFPKLLSSKILEKFIPVYGYYTKIYLELLAYPNNSFRMGRMFWAVLLCLIAFAYVSTRKDNNGSALRTAAATPKGAAVIGFVLGIGITWSNDFGFCCIGSAFLILLILTIADKYQRKQNNLLWKRFLYFFPALFVGVFISILLASQGNISSWFDFTVGVSQWQYTYYNENIREKVITLQQLLTSKATRRTCINLMFFIASMIYCLVKLCKDKADDRTILFVFLFVSIVATHIFYILGSGPDAFVEGTYGFVIIMFWAVIARIIIYIFEKIKLKSFIEKSAVCVTVLYIRFIAYQNVNIISAYKSENFPANDKYIEKLEGVNVYADQLKNMHRIVGNEPMFATFSTALDDMRGTFQPTGCDYVIHALGDKQNERYVQQFKDEKFKWVQTTNIDVWPWELWISRASWDLFKEIYSDYTIHSDHAVWRLWEYTGEDANVVSADVDIEINQLNSGEVQMIVRSDETRPCYVDIEIAWCAEKINNLANLTTFRHIVFVEDSSVNEGVGSFEGYFLKREGEGRHIGVYLENGEGVITFKAVPQESTTVKLISAKATEVILAQQ